MDLNIWHQVTASTAVSPELLSHELRIDPQAPPIYITLELTAAGLESMTENKRLKTLPEGWARATRPISENGELYFKMSLVRFVEDPNDRNALVDETAEDENYGNEFEPEWPPAGAVHAVVSTAAEAAQHLGEAECQSPRQSANSSWRKYDFRAKTVTKAECQVGEASSTASSHLVLSARFLVVLPPACHSSLSSEVLPLPRCPN